ncbi:MAG: transposase [Deltaproteobacteria bacterium]|nr:transposase [Deltaproteobacteria bacterium]
MQSTDPDPLPKRPPLFFSPEALLRYQVVSQVLAAVCGGKRLSVAVREVAARTHFSFDGQYRVEKVSRRSIYRWLRAFEAGGPSALEPAIRSTTLTSVVLPTQFVDFLRSEKTADPDASIPEVIRRAIEREILPPDDPPDRTTVFRAATRMGLPLTRRASKRDTDMRRFAYPHRMMMVLADGKHFRAGINHTRRVVLFFIDDASRYVPFAVVGTSESTELFLRGLFEVIRRVGLMDIIFLDNGAGFISHDTIAVCARLGVHLINGTAAYPEGHGKVERFNLTAWQDLLRALTAPGIDDELASLELRINHYLAHQYNTRTHESLEGLCPSDRWTKDDRALRYPTDDADLRDRFLITETRLVSADNVIPFESSHYEVPRGHAKTRIQIFRQTLDGTLSILHDGKRVRLHKVDLVANAIARRAPELTRPPAPIAPPITAAQLAFDRDFGPVVGPDGGFIPPSGGHKEK